MSRTVRLLLFGLSLVVTGQTDVTMAQSIHIETVVMDSVTVEPVSSAHVLLQSESKTWQRYSDDQGRLKLEIAHRGWIVIKIQRYGYKMYQQKVHVRRDTVLLFRLVPTPIHFSPVTIQANAPDRERQMQNAGQPVAVFTLREREALAATDVAAVLAYAPGVYIKDYGGMGGMKTVSLRGAASTQTPLFINGVRYDNFQTGSTDLSGLDVENFSELRVYRGGNAARFGANAMSGSIVLNTLPRGSALRLGAAGTAGSYGYQAAHLKLGGTLLGWRTLLAFSQRRARGDHAYVSREFGQTEIRRRKNADFTNASLLASVGNSWSRGQVNATLLAVGGERGVPGPVLQGREENRSARQRDRDWFAALQGRYQVRASSALHAWVKFRDSDLRYLDPELNLGDGGVDDRYHNRDGLVGLEIRHVAGTGLLRTRLEIGLARLQGNNLAVPEGGSYRRVPLVQRRFAHGLLMWEQALGRRRGASRELRVQAALRYSHYSDAGAALSPSLSLNWQPWARAIRFRAHAAHNFRVPTFSEQYYLNYGNQEIAPERGVSLDLGMNALADWAGRAMLDVSLFGTWLRDQIVGVPLSPVQWSTRNIGRTHTLGLEAQAEWRSWQERLRLALTYTLQNPRDVTPGSRVHGNLLIYTPQELLTAVAAVALPLSRKWTFAFSASLRRVSFRYHLPENDPESLMPGYTVADLTASLQLQADHWQMRLRLETENVFDTEYEVIYNYPVPLRLVRLRLDISSSGRSSGSD